MAQVRRPDMTSMYLGDAQRGDRLDASRSQRRLSLWKRDKVYGRAARYIADPRVKVSIVECVPVFVLKGGQSPRMLSKAFEVPLSLL